MALPLRRSSGLTCNISVNMSKAGGHFAVRVTCREACKAGVVRKAHGGSGPPGRCVASACPDGGDVPPEYAGGAGGRSTCLCGSWNQSCEGCHCGDGHLPMCQTCFVLKVDRFKETCLSFSTVSLSLTWALKPRDRVSTGLPGGSAKETLSTGHGRGKLARLGGGSGLSLGALVGKRGRGLLSLSRPKGRRWVGTLSCRRTSGSWAAGVGLPGPGNVLHDDWM